MKHYLLFTKEGDLYNSEFSYPENSLDKIQDIVKSEIIEKMKKVSKDLDMMLSMTDTLIFRFTKYDNELQEDPDNEGLKNLLTSEVKSLLEPIGILINIKNDHISFFDIREKEEFGINELKERILLNVSLTYKEMFEKITTFDFSREFFWKEVRLFKSEPVSSDEFKNDEDRGIDVPNCFKHKPGTRKVTRKTNFFKKRQHAQA